MEKEVAGAGAGKGIAVMARFLADENFNNDIIRGLLRRNPDMGKPSSPSTHPPNLA